MEKRTYLARAINESTGEIIEKTYIVEWGYIARRAIMNIAHHSMNPSNAIKTEIIDVDFLNGRN